MATSTSSKRLHDEAELAALVSQLRQEGRTIALTNGCYDLLHVGHLRALAGAKETAEVLIVALNADSSVRQWKGEGYPIVSEDERAELMAGFSCVDHVFVFTDPSVDGLLELIRPDAYCKGPEYSLENLPEAETVRRLGIRYCNVGDPKDHSSTSLAEQVAQAQAKRDDLASKVDEAASETCEQTGPAPSVEILDEQRIFEGFLNLDEIRLRHETPDGTMSPEMVRQNVERGNGAGVLLINTDHDTIVLTRQFRYAVWKRTGDGRTLEVPAGTVAADGDPEAVARSEAAEEVGYNVTSMHHTATFFASPGTTTEQVILYEAEVTDADRLEGRGGGLPEEHEYIEVIEMPVAEAIAKMESGEISDAKTVIALMALRVRRSKNEPGDA